MKFGTKILKEISNWSIENNWTLTKEILDIPVNLHQGIIKDLSVKLLAKLCQLVRIVTSLLQENLMTRFSINKQNRF